MTQTTARRKVLVMGSGSRAFLSVIRSLGRAGIEVHIVRQEVDHSAQLSRYVTRIHHLPTYNHSPQEWTTSLIDLMKRESFDLVLPTTDPTVIPLQEHRTELEPYGRLYVIDDQAYRILFDKLQTTALARRQGIPVPGEVVLNRSEDSEQVFATLSLPVVLKPPSSFQKTNLNHRQRVRTAHDRKSFRDYSAELLAHGPVAVQEYFEGEGVGVELLLKDGEPLLAFQHRRLHEPLFGGGSSYRQSVPLNPELLEAALKLLRPLAYTGVVMVEFRINPQTGKWVLLEANARFWGSLPLAVAAGVDFPLALFQLLVEGRTAFPQGYRSGICCRNLRLDVAWFWDNLRAHSTQPTSSTRPLPAVMLEACVNMLTLRERYDAFTLTDPLPFLSTMGETLGDCKRRLSSRSALIGRSLDRWLVPYLRQWRRRRSRKPGQPVHLLLCLADHFEPNRGNVGAERARDRVTRWVEMYPRLFGRFRDADGRAPQHTFFYPMEVYDAEHIDSLALLCRAGFGEVEVHLHHEGDTADTLRQRLLHYKEVLSGRHNLLARSRQTGELAYGFVHGNWALCNSRPDGLLCGVNDELTILRETGCYADFTFPSAPSPTQPRKINSLYYASSNASRPRGFDSGSEVGAGPTPDGSLMLIQGPLLLDWKRRKWRLLPGIENACLQGNQPPTPERLALWLRANVHVPTRPDWVFVKLHTHGAEESNQQVLLGEPMVRLHEILAQLAEEDPTFHVHYVTAREMYNLARAAEAGWQGSVAEARDFELVWNGQRNAGPDSSDTAQTGGQKAILTPC